MAGTTSISGALKLTLRRLVVVWIAVVLGCADSASRVEPEVPLASVSGVRLGMSERHLRAARPNVRNNSGILLERVSPTETIIYWFGRNFRRSGLPKHGLVAVVYSSDTAGREAAQYTVRQVSEGWTERFGRPNVLPTRAARAPTDTTLEQHAKVWKTDHWWLILDERALSDSIANGPSRITAAVHSPLLPPTVALQEE